MKKDKNFEFSLKSAFQVATGYVGGLVTGFSGASYHAAGVAYDYARYYLTRGKKQSVPDASKSKDTGYFKDPAAQ